MQENNFEAIINKWRRLSVVERKDHKEFVSMSEDSSNQQTVLKKNEDETNLIVHERSGTASTSIAEADPGSAVCVVAQIPPDIGKKISEEKQDLIKNDLEESKEASGDADHKEDSKDKVYLENNEVGVTLKSDNENLTDNVDSVFLRCPPPHKVRSNVSTPADEEEDCGIKCLYYTLQCCDCAIM